MRSVTTVIIGAGHAGLAMSRCLEERSIDHVLLERGEVGNSWRRERWDSLRLLTPNWQARLPGHGYEGSDPDGFMDMAEVVDFVSSYARVSNAPVETQTTVTAVRPSDGGYVVATDQGEWHCRCVVLASGACNIANVPKVAAGLPSSIESVTPMSYKKPDQLPEGGVMVVGASATGAQLAEEIHRSGRPVTLAVGEHVRMPRRYSGRDVLWWMEKCGLWGERYDEVDDIVRARNVPSPQLVGTPTHATLDLNTLTDAGVTLVGRLADIRDGRALFSGSLHNQCALADLKMHRMLNSFDEWAEEADVPVDSGAREGIEETRVPEKPHLDLDLTKGEIRTVLWATGFRPDYSWLQLPVLDRKGKLRHDGGVVSEAPGVYALGLTFLRRRNSSFICGAEEDARDLAAHLATHLAGDAAPAVAAPAGA